MKRNIPKHRKMATFDRFQYLNRGNIVKLPNEYQLTKSGGQFLMFSSCEKDPEKMFVFSSEIAMRFLLGLERWLSYGTFRVSPEIFFFKYILCTHNNVEKFSSASLVYCLTKPKLS